VPSYLRCNPKLSTKQNDRSNRYKIDFNNPVNRSFEDDKEQLKLFDFVSSDHINQVIRDIRKSSMPFVRIGEMGDPSEDWEHTLTVCDILSMAKKPIVIITKHWKILSEVQCMVLGAMNIVINTSISALDSQDEIDHRLNQYKRLKKYCKSVLRVVTCNFNTTSKHGNDLKLLQDELLGNGNVINTVFRPSKNNPLLENNTIIVSKKKFLRSMVLASSFDKNAYMGMCDTCPDMCGI
jgi:hypothetical protein